MFYRGAKASTGSGIGMYITKETITTLGGTIEIQSELKQGTKFTISIPNMMKA